MFQPFPRINHSTELGFDLLVVIEISQQSLRCLSSVEPITGQRQSVNEGLMGDFIMSGNGSIVCKERLFFVRCCSVFVFALSVVKLSTDQSTLVLLRTPLEQCSMVQWSRAAKKIPNTVGTRSHSCFTSLFSENGLEEHPSKLSFALISMWKETSSLSSIGDQPIVNTFQMAFWPDLLTVSNAFVNKACEQKHLVLYALLLNLSQRRDLLLLSVCY